MIEVTRFNGSKLILNALLVERIEQTPDTVVTLTTGRQFVVKETPDQLCDAVAGYLRCLRDPGAVVVTDGEIARLIG